MLHRDNPGYEKTKLPQVNMNDEDEKMTEISWSESEDCFSELIMDVGQDMKETDKIENSKIDTKSNDSPSTKGCIVSEMDSITLTDRNNPIEKKIFEWEMLNDIDVILSEKSSGDISKLHGDEQLSIQKDWNLISNVEDVISLNSSFGNNITARKCQENHTCVDPVTTDSTDCKIQSEENHNISDTEEEEVSLYYDSNSSIPRVSDDDSYFRRNKSIKLSFEDLYDAYFERDCYKNTRGGKSTIMFKGNGPHFQWKRTPQWVKRMRAKNEISKQRMEMRRWTQNNKKFFT